MSEAMIRFILFIGIMSLWYCGKDHAGDDQSATLDSQPSSCSVHGDVKVEREDSL